MKRFILSLFTLANIAAFAQTQNDGLKALDFERYEYARNLFKSLITQEPAKGDNYYYLGQAYIYLLQPDSAQMAYQNGMTADATNAFNYVGLGEILMNENKVTEARVMFDKALSFSKGRDGKPTNARVLAMVAEAMVDGENKLLDDAKKHIDAALEIDKKNYDIQIMAGDVMLERNEGGPAATHYENAISIDKMNPKAYTRVAGIWLRVKNAEATFTALTKAIEIDSNYAPALKSLSEYFYQVKKFEKAKENYKKYLKNSEESMANKTRFAQILYRTKEYEEALLKIDEIQKSDKNNIYLYRLSGYCNYEVAESKKDTSKYRAGLASLLTFFEKADPKKIIQSDYEYLGKLYSKVPGKDSMAIIYLNKALEMDSSKTDLYRDLAMTYNKSKKFNEAVTYFEIAIAKAKRPMIADYFLLGRACYFAKQFGKADTAFIKVSDLKPDYAEAYLWRGNTNANIDPDAKTTVAKDMYEKYIVLAEPNADKNKNNLITSYMYMATYFIKKDDSKTAREYLNKVTTLDPANETAQKYLKQLK